MSEPQDLPWRAEAGHVLVSVRVIPNAGRDHIDGADRLADGRPVLKARVAAVAREGEANHALVRLIARVLDLPRSAISVTGGEKQRLKRIRIDGDVTATLTRLQRLTQGNET